MDCTQIGVRNRQGLADLGCPRVRSAVLGVAGFKHFTSLGSGRRAHFGHIIAAGDRERDRLVNESPPIVGGPCHKGLGHGLAFSQVLCGYLVVVQGVGPHTSRCVDGHHTVSGRRCPLQAPGACGAHILVSGQQLAAGNRTASGGHTLVLMASLHQTSGEFRCAISGRGIVGTDNREAQGGRCGGAPRIGGTEGDTVLSAGQRSSRCEAELAWRDGAFNGSAEESLTVIDTQSTAGLSLHRKGRLATGGIALGQQRCPRV